MVRIGVLMAWAGLLGACVSVKEEEPGPFIPMLEPAECVAGQRCYCDGVLGGTTTCVDGLWSCDCSACVPLTINELPLPASCGGELTGTWLLTDFELSPSTISVTFLSTLLATCDTVFDAQEPPFSLMSLGADGLAEYFTKSATVTQSWMNSCVENADASLSCGSARWMNVSNCRKDCDICSCDIQTTANDVRSSARQPWETAGATLTIAPFGVDLTGSYCVQGEVLAISSDAGYLAFRRVFRGPSCELADVGNRAGCELLDQLPTCRGEVVPCGTHAMAVCGTVPGCAATPGGSCEGPALDCANVEGTCVAPCALGANGCEGMSSCAAFDTLQKCHGEANVIFPDNPCRWVATECSGIATPCAEMAPERCSSAPGCELMFP